MGFLPEMKIGFLNGWLPLAIFYTSFGIFLFTCKKSIIKKLYSIKGWSKREYILSTAGKPFSMAFIGIMIFTPLEFNVPRFYAGLIIYCVGFVIMFIALFEYKHTPSNQAVTGGIYQHSRNPQWLGLLLILFGAAIMTGNGLALIFQLLTVVLYHFRILGEERACLAAYGDAYQRYMDAVPRYI